MSYLWTRNKGEKLKASCQQWLRKHREDSGFREFSALSKLCLGGQVRSSEMPYVSYPRPLCGI